MCVEETFNLTGSAAVSVRLVVGSLSSVSTWSPVQVVADQRSADILIPVNHADTQPGTEVVPQKHRYTSTGITNHFLTDSHRCTLFWCIMFLSPPLVA